MHKFHWPCYCMHANRREQCQNRFKETHRIKAPIADRYESSFLCLGSSFFLSNSFATATLNRATLNQFVWILHLLQIRDYECIAWCVNSLLWSCFLCSEFFLYYDVKMDEKKTIRFDAEKVVKWKKYIEWKISFFQFMCVKWIYMVLILFWNSNVIHLKFRC